MFSLIVTLIAILLVAAIALATMYFGGSSWTDSTQQADVARLLNEGQQITAAAVTHHVQKQSYATNINQLVAAEYLKAPPSTNWQPHQDSAVITDVAEEQCLALNAKHNITGIPMCSDPSVVGKSVCCQEP